MKEALGRGGGGKIALDPVGLRTSARKLRDVRAELDLDASRLAAKPVPVMPAGLGAAAAAELAAIAANLRAESVGVGVTADDLDRRVLIAEVTDALDHHAPLSAATLALLVRELSSGGLLTQVSPEEASLLGRAMGKALLDEQDSKVLLELSAIVERDHNDPGFAAFAAGVIHGFGPGKFPLLVIQATDLGEPQAGRVIGELALVVASATAGKPAQLSSKDQRLLAQTGDKQALGMLLTSKHDYGSPFLIAVGNYSFLPMLRGGGVTYPPGAFEMLGAISRNGRAAAYVLAPGGTEQTGARMAELWGKDWEDGGAELGSAYTKATNYLQGQAHLPDHAGRDLSKLSVPERAALLRANTLTYAAIDQTLKNPNDAMTHALAGDLAAHHIDDLTISANQRHAATEISVPPNAHDPRLTRLSLRSERDLLVVIAGQPPDDVTLNGAVASYNANVIATHAHDPSAGVAWASPMLDLHAVSIDAHDQLLEGNYHNAAEVHATWIKIITGGTSLGLDVTGGDHIPGAAFTLNEGIAAIDHVTAPSPDQLTNNLSDANGLAENSMKASIMAVYHQNGGLPAPTSVTDPHTHKMLSYPTLVHEAQDAPKSSTRQTRLNDKVGDYEAWINGGQVGAPGSPPDPIVQKIGNDIDAAMSTANNTITSVLDPNYHDPLG